MWTVGELHPADPAPVLPGGGIAPLADAVRLRHAPDRHLLALDADGRLAARCSCWWTHAPPLEGHVVGAIGHYAAADPGAAARLLDHACRLLHAEGCTLAVGPMDGSTWRAYRFIVERGPEPAFFLEPDHPDDWPAHFAAAGFAVLAGYSSALDAPLVPDDPAVDARIASAEARGIRIRPFDPAGVDAELGRIFALSLESFRGNFLYAPIGEAEFREQYLAVLPAVRPELVLMAERDGDLVGFLLALPDALEARRTGETRTVILKTVAVAPAVARGGLGTLLIALGSRDAARLGFTRAIHALMHDRNPSRRISGRSARTIRRYALFARPLGPGAAA